MKEIDVWKQAQGQALFRLEDKEAATDLISQISSLYASGFLSELGAVAMLNETVKFYTNQSMADD